MAEELRASLQLDISQFTASLQQASQRLQSFAQSINQQMASLGQSTQQFGQSQQQTTQQTQALTAAMGRLTEVSRAQLSTMQDLATTARVHTQALTNIENSLEQTTRGTQRATDATNTWRQAMQIAAGIGLATTLQGLISQLTTFATSVVQVGVKFEAMRQTFGAMTGSVVAGAQQFQQIITLAQRLGVGLDGLIDGFKTLAAATRGTTLAGGETMKIFEGVVTAAKAMGASTEDTRGAILALSQMVSKGVVSMEELRRQLGNAIPGAFQIAARAIGVTTEELNRMVSEGEVRAVPFVRAFARQLQQELGPAAEEAAKTAGSAFTRLWNEIVLTKNAIANSGIVQALGTIAGAVSDVAEKLRKLSEARDLLAQTTAQAGLIGTGIKSSQFSPKQMEDYLALTKQILDAQEQLKKASDSTLSNWVLGTVPKAQLEDTLKNLQDQKQALLDQVQATAKVREEQGKLTAEVNKRKMAEEQAAEIQTQMQEQIEKIAKARETFTKQAAALPAMFGSQTGDLESQKKFWQGMEAAIKEPTEALSKLRAQLKATMTDQNAGGLAKANQDYQATADKIDTITEKIKARDKAERDAATAAKQLERERQQMTADMTANIIRITGDEFEERRHQLAVYTAEARKAGVSETLIAQNAAAERLSIAQDETAKKIALQQQQIASAKQAESAAIAREQAQFKALDELTRLGLADDAIERKRISDLQRLADVRERLSQQSVTTDEALAQQLATAEDRINQNALDDRAKKNEEAARRAIQPWQDLARSIEGTLSGVFQSIFDHTFDLWDTLKQGFKRLLSDLMAQALTTQIIIPIGMSLLGGGGLAGGGSLLGLGTSLVGAAAAGTGEGGATGGGLGGTAGLGTASLLGQGLQLAGLGPGLGGLLGTTILGGASAGSVFGAGSATAAATGAGAYATGADAAMVSAAAPAAAGLTVGGAITGIGAGVGVGFLAHAILKQLGLSGRANTALSGMAGGATTGALVGSVVPGVGTAIGAIVGAAAGGILGALVPPGKKMRPFWQSQDVTAGGVSYDSTLGLSMTTPFSINQSHIRDVGQYQGWSATMDQINTALNTMAGQVLSTFQGVSPQLQASLVGPLNDAFTQIADEIKGLKIDAKDPEGFASMLETTMNKTIPDMFSQAANTVLGKLNAAIQKIDPVLKQFNEVIATLTQDIQNLSDQQAQMHSAIGGAAQSIQLATGSPVDTFTAGAGNYQQLLQQYQSANPQQRILLAPMIAQAAQSLMGSAQQRSAFDIQGLQAQSGALQMRTPIDLSSVAGSLSGSYQSLTTELYSPAQSYMFAQKQYAGLLNQFYGASSAADKTTLAPQVAQAATSLLSMAKSTDVLGQDPKLVRNLQANLGIQIQKVWENLSAVVQANNQQVATENQAVLAKQAALAQQMATSQDWVKTVQGQLLSDLTNLQQQTDDAYGQLKGALQGQLDIATQQVTILQNSLSNLGSVDSTVQSSLAVLHGIQDALGIQVQGTDAATQGQIALLGGIQQVGQQQLSVLTQIATQLGATPHFQHGGYIERNMFAFLHKGETVVPAHATDGGTQTLNVTIRSDGHGNLSSTNVDAVADAVVQKIIKGAGRYGTIPLQVKRG